MSNKKPAGGEGTAAPSENVPAVSFNGSQTG